QIDSQIREHDADAVIVIEPRFHDALPAAVRHWKALRPDRQGLFIFRRLPHTRALVELMRSGAFDVLDTEIEAIGRPVINRVRTALQRRLDEIRTGGLERDHARDALSEVGLIGESAEMQSLFVQVLQAARLDCPVLISGEPGSGKRLVAHAIHTLSSRGGGQIVTADCQSLSPVLMGVSLFGANFHSQNGSGPSRGPLFIAAEHGTLLLNEISEMAPVIQGYLHRTLEAADSNDARLISTTSQRLDRLVESKCFRPDLCYRLNALPIE